MTTDAKRIILGETITTNSDNPSSSGQELAGGAYTAIVDGTYNGATVSLEAADGKQGTFVALSGATFDSGNVEPGTVTLGTYMKIKAVVTNAGASTSLNVTLVPIPR